MRLEQKNYSKILKLLVHNGNKLIYTSLFLNHNTPWVRELDVNDVTMKVLSTNQPEGVNIPSRLGSLPSMYTLTKTFRYLAVDNYMLDKKTIKVEKWFGRKKELASVCKVCLHIESLIKGVT